MSDDVFQAVASQLRAVSFRGRISYHLYNEPLLRKDLARLVGTMDNMVPGALQILNTNGDLLDDARYRSLRAAGIDYFYVTRHSEGPYPERPFQVVQTAADLVLTNRGGSLTHLPPATLVARRTPCFAPSEMLVVTVTGDVLLCYEDAHRDHVLGNVLVSTLEQIWTERRFAEIRSRLEAGNRSATDMCMRCSNVSHSRTGLSALEDPVLSSNGLSRGVNSVEILKSRSDAARSGTCDT
jgi:2-deoxy-scyllo-inosamine dehydrogenase (SAM-dependent)